MTRNRLLIRVALIVAFVVIYFVKRDHMSPDAAKGFLVAMVFAITFTVGRMIYEARQKKSLEQNTQAAANTKDVELFTKPKDF